MRSADSDGPVESMESMDASGSESKLEDGGADEDGMQRWRRAWYCPCARSAPARRRAPPLCLGQVAQRHAQRTPWGSAPHCRGASNPGPDARSPPPLDRKTGAIRT